MDGCQGNRQSQWEAHAVRQPRRGPNKQQATAAHTNDMAMVAPWSRAPRRATSGSFPDRSGRVPLRVKVTHLTPYTTSKSTMGASPHHEAPMRRMRRKRRGDYTTSKSTMGASPAHEAHDGRMRRIFAAAAQFIPNSTGNILHYPQLYRKLSAFSPTLLETSLCIIPISMELSALSLTLQGTFCTLTELSLTLQGAFCMYAPLGCVSTVMSEVLLEKRKAISPWQHPSSWTLTNILPTPFRGSLATKLPP
jgi:hypothetical protein